MVSLLRKWNYAQKSNLMECREAVWLQALTITCDTDWKCWDLSHGTWYEKVNLQRACFRPCLDLPLLPCWHEVNRHPALNTPTIVYLVTMGSKQWGAHVLKYSCNVYWSANVMEYSSHKYSSHKSEATSTEATSQNKPFCLLTWLSQGFCFTNSNLINIFLFFYL